VPTVFARPADLLEGTGRDLGRSEWLEITPERVVQFHEAVGEDPSGADVPPFLLLSLVNWFLPQLLEVQGASMGVNYGTGEVRFPEPVTVGARIRGDGQIVAAEPVGPGVQVTVRVTVEVEGGEQPACVVDTVSRFLP
jgi:acyl dehydratase